MIKYFPFMLGFLISINTLSFDGTKYCACSELDQTNCAILHKSCSWNSNTLECIPMQCKLQSSNQCTLTNSAYKCQWNNSSQICEDHTYSCSDILSVEDCDPQITRYYGLDCTWTTEGKCTSFSCQTSDQDQCDLLQCSENYNKNTCSNSINSCSGITYDACFAQTGHNSLCLFGDDNQCYEVSPAFPTCSSLNNFSEICQLLNYCIYDTTNNTCRDILCTDLDQDSCGSIFNNNNYQITYCVLDTSCRDATQSDISKLKSASDCITTTNGNYKWTGIACISCTNFQINPLYAATQDQSMQIIKLLISFAFVWLI